MKNLLLTLSVISAVLFSFLFYKTKNEFNTAVFIISLSFFVLTLLFFLFKKTVVWRSAFATYLFLSNTYILTIAFTLLFFYLFASEKFDNFGLAFIVIPLSIILSMIINSILLYKGLKNLEKRKALILITLYPISGFISYLVF